MKPPLLHRQEDGVDHRSREFFVILGIKADGVMGCTDSCSCKCKVTSGMGDGAMIAGGKQRQPIIATAHDGADCASAVKRRARMMSPRPKLTLALFYPALVPIGDFVQSQGRQPRDRGRVHFTVGRMHGDVKQLGQIGPMGRVKSVERVGDGGWIHLTNFPYWACSAKAPGAAVDPRAAGAQWKCCPASARMPCDHRAVGAR